MENAKSKGAILGRPTKTIDNLPTSFMKHQHKYEHKEITQKEFAQLCGVTRQSIAKYNKIYHKAHEEKYCEGIVKEAIKSTKEEEKRLKSHRRMTDKELEFLAIDEEREAEIDGVTRDFTPATYEIERRYKKFHKKKEEEDYKEMFERYRVKDIFISSEYDLCLPDLNVLDLSEFD
jgi:transcriptional regulator with XRE-family HTH domain